MERVRDLPAEASKGSCITCYFLKNTNVILTEPLEVEVEFNTINITLYFINW